MLITFLVTAIVCAGIMFGAMVVLRNSVTATAGGSRERVLTDVTIVTDRLNELVKFKDSYASKGQLATLAEQAEQLEKSLGQEKNALAEIEKKLDVAQKNVEGKEAQQQEMKSAKEEDERKLQGLLESFQNTSDEAVALEQRLAASLKNIDKMKEQLTLTNDQRAMIDNLSSALENSGGRLRDLLMEYSSVNERLVQLTQQHTDLEEEYTKLVEQQLGE